LLKRFQNFLHRRREERSHAQSSGAAYQRPAHLPIQN
jgi:hypothetical protein